MKTISQVNLINEFLKNIKSTEQLIDKVKYFQIVDGDQYAQVIIRPDFSIIGVYRTSSPIISDEEIILGRFQRNDIENLVDFILQNRIDYGTVYGGYYFDNDNFTITKQ